MNKQHVLQKTNHLRIAIPWWSNFLLCINGKDLGSSTSAVTQQAVTVKVL